MPQKGFRGHRKLELRLAAVLCYLLLVMGGIIMLTFERESRFVRFHALQSILFGAAVIILLIALTLAGLSTASIVMGLAASAIWLMLIYRAAIGELFQLPWLGWLAERNA